ncbi:uncharacterized protein LOC110912912 isoform X4 [Helianthus annuus]|uniref:uncharacterized protein LOC110912912 isoform X4 n=1 Tax=Helianthus annuus TaxID=4232 RepID=UPI00165339C6|nr:uncharacterized protein LOC110912912 isoform X4 [Helianthus annuus]XP_035835768.1 uncharacterized protein LOC110912912 isoform X4 [Helianthus annuus]
MARLLALRIVIEPATFSFWCKSDAPLTMMKTTVEGLEGLANQLPCVMKFGGSSVASVDRMKEVAELIFSFPEENHVIVLSAMGKTTNKLIADRENAASCISDVSEIDESSFVKELHYRLSRREIMSYKFGTLTCEKEKSLTNFVLNVLSSSFGCKMITNWIMILIIVSSLFVDFEFTITVFQIRTLIRIEPLMAFCRSTQNRHTFEKPVKCSSDKQRNLCNVLYLHYFYLYTYD